MAMPRSLGPLDAMAGALFQFKRDTFELFQGILGTRYCGKLSQFDRGKLTDLVIEAAEVSPRAWNWIPTASARTSGGRRSTRGSRGLCILYAIYVQLLKLFIAVGRPGRHCMP